jgi:hypothetical protein
MFRTKVQEYSYVRKYENFNTLNPPPSSELDKINLSLYTVMKALGEWKYSSTHS